VLILFPFVDKQVTSLLFWLELLNWLQDLVLLGFGKRKKFRDWNYLGFVFNLHPRVQVNSTSILALNSWSVFTLRILMSFLEQITNFLFLNDTFSFELLAFWEQVQFHLSGTFLKRSQLVKVTFLWSFESVFCRIISISLYCQLRTVPFPWLVFWTVCCLINHSPLGNLEVIIWHIENRIWGFHPHTGRGEGGSSLQFSFFKIFLMIVTWPKGRVRMFGKETRSR